MYPIRTLLLLLICLRDIASYFLKSGRYHGLACPPAASSFYSVTVCFVGRGRHSVGRRGRIWLCDGLGTWTHVTTLNPGFVIKWLIGSLVVTLMGYSMKNKRLVMNCGRTDPLILSPDGFYNVQQKMESDTNHGRYHPSPHSYSTLITRYMVRDTKLGSSQRSSQSTGRLCAWLRQSEW